jgi:FkbH-like protein
MAEDSQNKNHDDGLLTILASVFETTPEHITEETVKEDLPKWDSLRQIILVNVLEQNFGLSISNAEAADLVSIKAIRDCIARGASAPGHTPSFVSVTPTAAGPKTLDALRRQSGHAPNLSQIYEGAQLLQDEAARSEWKGETVRIAVLGDLTIDLLVAAISYAVFQEGTLPTVYTAPFGSLVQEVIDPHSRLHRFKPDVVVLAADWREHVANLPISATSEDVNRELSGRVELFKSLWSQIAAGGATRIIQHMLVPPARDFRGLADRLSPASLANQCATLNRMLVEAAGERVQWVEVDSLAERVGRARWSSDRHYHASRLPFDPAFLPDYTAYFRAAWRAGAAKGKKVLALDLDNTLWGGVIGDDGVEGIKLGTGSPEGEAFAEWGRYAKQLAARGVILAICSKNNATLAATGFDHPQSPLKLDDFAATEISWDDKATGLRRLASKLNVGIDSFVFADDNPFECDLIRQSLPEVGVVELGNDPSTFIDTLEKSRWFDAALYTKEDFGRAQAYQARSAAESERENATDIGSYLRSLEMEARVYDADESDLARLSQMEKKTNQFNLTTRRYSAEQLATFVDREDAILLACDLKDRHADHGLVSSLVAMREGDALRIDSWLMSCRVFSRSFEDYILNTLIDRAAEAGVQRISGEYLPTAKNIVVSDLYERLGFSRSDPDGHRWELALGNLDEARRPTFIGATSGAPESAPTPAPAPAKAAEPTLAHVDLPDLIAAGHAASQQRNFAEAARFWKEVTLRDPSQSDPFIYLTEAYRGMGEIGAATQATQDGIRHHPGHPGIHFQYAATAESAGDWPESLSRWQEARQRFREYPEPGHGIAVAYLHLGRSDEAEAAFSENVQNFPSHSWSGLGHAEAASRRGDWDTAVLRLTKLQRVFPERAEIAVHLVIALAHSGALAQARDLIDATIRDFPDNILVQEHRTWVLSLQEDWPAALDQAETTMTQSGDLPVSVDLARRARFHLRRTPRKALVIYGNCQGAVLNGLTTRLRAIYEDFEVFHLLGHVPEEQAKLADPILDDAVLLWEQYDERASVPMRDELRERVGPNCRRLVYPSLSMFSLWPFNWPDTRNHPEPRFPFGRYPYDGDSIAIEIAKDGLTGEKAFERYMEMSRQRLRNLGGQFDRDVEQLRRRDSFSDIRMADYVLDNYRKNRMFFTWGHVAGQAVKEIAVKLLARSHDILNADLSRLEDNMSALPIGIDDFWMPIHPDVAAWHKLDFAQGEDTLYNIYGNWWTFKEFMIKYIEYDESW